MASIELDGTELALLGACVQDRIERFNSNLSATAELAALVDAEISEEEKLIIAVRRVHERIVEKITVALVEEDTLHSLPKISGVVGVYRQ